MHWCPEPHSTCLNCRRVFTRSALRIRSKEHLDGWCLPGTGVFHGVQEVVGVRCVHPVQVYVDLKGHPERADEAAEHLLREHLKWGEDA